MAHIIDDASDFPHQEIFGLKSPKETGELHWGMKVTRPLSSTELDHLIPKLNVQLPLAPEMKTILAKFFKCQPALLRKCLPHVPPEEIPFGSTNLWGNKPALSLPFVSDAQKDRFDTFADNKFPAFKGIWDELAAAWKKELKDAQKRKRGIEVDPEPTTAQADPKTPPARVSRASSVSPTDPVSQPQLLAWEVELLGIEHEEEVTPVPAAAGLPSPADRAKEIRKRHLEKAIQLAKLNSEE